MRRCRPLVERFEEKYIPEPNTGCWLWTGTLDVNGYGVMGLGRRGDGTARATRICWNIYRGPIPLGKVICHKCDVPSCVNPDHLWLGTMAENSRDMVRKGRHWMYGITKCKHGHPFTAENTMFQRGGFRKCRICKNLGNRRYRDANKRRLSEQVPIFKGSRQQDL